jgi:predicted O-methyltransferase YrrM
MIDELYRRRVLPLADGSEKPMDVYIPREEGDYLYTLVRDLKPEVTVEVGMANGLSTLFITQALRDNGFGRHIAIDPFQFSDWGGAGVSLLQHAGLDHLVDVIQKPSHQALPELEQAGLSTRMIFIDGSHLFDYVLSDFLCADRLLEVGGVIAFDDSDWVSINQVIRFVLANRSYLVESPEIVIEKVQGRPTLLGNVLRKVAKHIPKLGSKLRHDFLEPSQAIGIQTRCVVLRKQGPDDRDGQSRFHQDF